MSDDVRLAELLSTKLCHDLTGPIGAVGNGAEFLADEGFNMQGQAVELIVSSAASAVARLQFYRMAYGYVKDHGEASLLDKRKLVEDYFAGGKIELDWPEAHTDAAGVSLSLKMVRLIFNSIVIASHTLIRGGKLQVRLEQVQGVDNKEKIITLLAEGPSVKWDKEMSEAVLAPMQVNDLSPKNVQYYLTQCLAKELNAKLEVAAEPEKFTLIIRQTVRQEMPVMDTLETPVV